MESRTRKSFRNVLTGIISKMIVFIFAFIVRTIFVRKLGAEYNGINGLFANILSVVCLADLGIENVLNFALYKELKDNNRDKIIQLIASFRKVYCAFAAFIMSVGLMIMLILRFIVDTTVPLSEVYLYYLLYLLNAVVSYLFVFKTTIISADQNQYISNILFSLTRILMYILQTIWLLVFRSMLGYLVIQIICTLLHNLALNFISVRRYPYLTKINKTKSNNLSQNLKNNIASTLLYRGSTVAIDNTDNIIISSVLGTFWAGLYSNYYMLVQYVGGVIYIAGKGLLASIGSLNAESDSSRTYENFKSVNLIYAIVGNIYFCCFANCVQQFVPIWVGREYLLTDSFALAIIGSFYLGIIMMPVTMFRETMGLFGQVKISMLIAAIINIIFSIVLAKNIGMTGVVLATIISKLATQFWYEPMVLFKRMGITVKYYFMSEVKYFFMTMISFGSSDIICRWLGSTFIDVILRALLSVLICIMISLIFNFRTMEFADLRKKIKTLIKT